MAEQDERGPGVVEALERIQNLRQQLGAQTVMVIFDLAGGAEVTLVADEDGTDVFADGEQVPRRTDAD